MKEVKVKLGKRTYTLGFGTKALRVFEREADMSIDKMAERFGVDTIASLIHAGMVYHHPEVSADDVDEMLDSLIENGGDVEKVITTVAEAAMSSGWFANPTTAVDSTKDSGEKPAE